MFLQKCRNNGKNVEPQNNKHVITVLLIKKCKLNKAQWGNVVKCIFCE